MKRFSYHLLFLSKIFSNLTNTRNTTLKWNVIAMKYVITRWVCNVVYIVGYTESVQLNIMEETKIFKREGCNKILLVHLKLMKALKNFHICELKNYVNFLNISYTVFQSILMRTILKINIDFKWTNHILFHPSRLKILVSSILSFHYYCELTELFTFHTFQFN